MKKIEIKVKTKSKIYPIIIGKNIISQIPKILKTNNINFEKCLIVVDKRIPKIKLNILKKKIVSKKKIILFFNANEKNKNFQSVDLILSKLFKVVGRIKSSSPINHEYFPFAKPITFFAFLAKPRFSEFL